MSVDPAPFLVTLALDEASQAAFDALRRRHFPPKRLLIGAHLTMFHALPAQHGAAGLDDCRDAAHREPFAVRR